MVKSLILGVDAGLSSVKVVGPKGEVSFESQSVLEPSGMKKFGKRFDIDDRKRFELTVDGEKYLLGEHAKFIQQFNKFGYAGHDGTGSKNDEAAFVRAIGGICRYLDMYGDFEDENIDIYLSYGSPILSAVDEEEVIQIENYFKNDGEPVEVTYNDINLNLTIKDIIVLPEGAAAFFAEEFNMRNVYILDAGSQTINLAALQDGVPIPTATDTLTNGVEAFKEMYQHNAPKMLAKTAKAKMAEMRWPKGSTIHVCGGYSDQIAEAFNAIRQNPYTMEIMQPELPMARKSKPLQPIYANAAGLYFIAKEAFATAVKG